MAVLPSSTVTFLFTDIEGSTRRWEHHPGAMKAAVERHDAILRQAIEDNGGHIFRTEGDAFRAAFANAPQALRAALDAQQALNAESWAKEIDPIRVRMAMHTGAVEIREGDYVGPSLNRMARLFSSAPQGRLAGLEQLITLLNRERRNNRLYVTLLQPTPTLLVEDKELPNAPLSQINVLDQRRNPVGSILLRESTAGEWSVPLNQVISGLASVNIAVK